MSSRKISQREARRLAKRVVELEQHIKKQRDCWAKDFPGGIHIATIDQESAKGVLARIHTARRLGHAVVATDDNQQRIEFRALPLPVIK